MSYLASFARMLPYLALALVAQITINNAAAFVASAPSL